MNSYLLSIGMIVLAGFATTTQAAINARLGASGMYQMIIGVSLVQAIISGLMLLRAGTVAFNSLLTPWTLIAGLLGVIIMYGLSSAIPVIGTLPAFVILICVQIVGSALIDHFGLFGSPQLPLTIKKIASIVIILAGVVMLAKSS